MLIAHKILIECLDCIVYIGFLLGGEVDLGETTLPNHLRYGEIIMEGGEESPLSEYLPQLLPECLRPDREGEGLLVSDQPEG